MKVLKLTLHKSKRLGFNGIKTFTYTPDRLYQIILGTNGSGKSTLMGELSPLPANGADYFKGGSKDIVIEHSNKHYELGSDFTNKTAGHHTFVCDGVELNEGGTVTVQRQLVKEHFDFDKDLFELLTGEASFREMSSNQRRYWLVRMADDNMEYAIKLYNDVNKRLREVGAVVKYLDEQLTTTTQMNPDIDKRQKELAERETILKKAHRELSRLDSPESGTSTNELRSRVTKGFTVIHDLSKSIVELKHPDQFMLDSPADIQRYQGQLGAEYNQVMRDIEELTDEHTKVKQTVEALIKQEVDSVGSLEKLLKDVVERQSKHQSSVNRFKSILSMNAKALSDACEAVDNVLDEILNELPDNSNKHFNRAQLEISRNAQESIRQQVAGLDKQIGTKQHILDHLNQGDKVQCPSCNLRFLPGMTHYDHDTVVAEREALGKTKTALLEELKGHDDYLQNMQEYLNIHNRLKSLMSSTPILAPLWEAFNSHPLTEYAPSKYLSLFVSFNQEVLTALEAEKLQPNIDEMTQAIKFMQGQSQNEVVYNKGALEKIEVKLNALTIKKHTLSDDLDRVAGYQRLHNVTVVKNEELNNTTNYLGGLIDQYFKVGMQDFISQEIDEVNRQLGAVAHELSTLGTIKHHIADLTSEREKNIKQKELLDLLSKQLSPVSGMIADYSLKFITQFTDQMNAIIKGVWTYDMQLQPLAMSEDLTYKFPVNMGGSGTQSPDINRLSSAQKRMIDFAFKILLITYLELEDYPLYIDELTPNLDETHSINITDYLKAFVDSGRCSQLFMTSHYVSGHNTFRDADFVVINASNLLHIPDEYNTNAIFEYEG